MESLFFIGLTSGSLLSSFVYAATNAATTIGISGCITTLGTLFVIFFVPESLHIRQTQEAKEAAAATTSGEKEMPITASDLQPECMSIDCPPILMNPDFESEQKKHVHQLPTPATPNMTFDEDLLAKYVEQLPPKVKARAQAQSKQQPDAKKAGLFSFSHIREMVNTCTKPRENHARAIIWLVTLAMCLSIFVFGKLNRTHLKITKKQGILLLYIQRGSRK